MGKVKPRLGSRKGAKRWKKGQSSSSNPTTDKFRNQARSWFFQEVIGSKGLTTDKLEKHDALQGPMSKLSMNVDEQVEESMKDGTVKTFKTFASDWSDCSNASFSKFMQNFQSNSAIHKEMLAILAAVTEVIKEQGGQESSTEYYAALMTALEASETEESICAILSLLGMGLKSVPTSVLQQQFGEACQTFLTILIKHASSENFLIVRNCIGCISLMLRAQEPIVWTNSSTARIFDGILAFTVHAKPKVRKAAQHAVCAVLKGSDLMRGENPPDYHPAAPQAAKHCIAQLEAAGQPGSNTTTLHTLTLLKDIIPIIPKSHVKTICEALLKIMTLKDALITSCCLQTFHGLFVSRPSENILPVELNAQIINALYDYQPSENDVQPIMAWLVVMQEAYCNLAKNSVNLAAANLPRILEKCTELWLSEELQVVNGTTQTLKTLLTECVALLVQNNMQATRYRTTVRAVIHTLQRGLKYQYHSAWYQVLHVLGVLFQVAGQCCKDDLVPVLSDLADFRAMEDSKDLTYLSEIEYTIGAAVKSMGPEIVLKTIPLQSNPDNFNINRSWMLKVLKDCITHASLKYFVENLLPLALTCEKKSTEAKAKNDMIEAHKNELLNSQIWALLPSFCNNASDVKENFKSIAKVLGMAISSKKELKLSVMACLRKLITRAIENEKQEDAEELAKFAKNYLPILFNIYTTKPKGTDEEGHRLSAFDTIQVYLSITSKDLVGDLFDKAIAKLEEEGAEEYFKESISDLIRIMAKHIDEERLKDYYDKCTQIIMDDKKLKEQKKAYRFLEDLCGSDSEVCRKFVTRNRKPLLKILLKAQAKTVTISKGPRLRCLRRLVDISDSQAIKLYKAILPEAVLGVKELNEKCRTSAYQLITSIIEKLLPNKEAFDDFIRALTTGFAGSPIYISATILATASITFHFNASLGTENLNEILENICKLMESPSREIVLSTLSFVKVYLGVIPTPQMAINLQKLVNGIVSMTEDCKRHFRQKLRDILVKLIRKFSYEIISSAIPKEQAMLHKRLKNLNKIESRKKKTKEQKRTQEESSDDEFNAKRRPKTIEEILADSDEEFENGDADETSKKGQKRTSRKEAWIQENQDSIVDLIDPTAARNITATRPGTTTLKAQKPKEKDGGFKTGPDGRLIIKDLDSDDEEEKTAGTKQKKKLPFLGSDAESDLEEDDKSVKQQPRKRKLSDGTESVATQSMYKAGGSGIHRPLKAPKVDKAPGVEFRAKKAGGDIKRKGKVDPYAYLPLTRSVLNRRKKKKMEGRFKSVIAGAKKGAMKGSRNKSNNKSR